VVISRANFGCGSSREHAPWAFEVNGINVIIACSYARIFRQNMFNCGMLAIELSEDIIDEIFNRFKGKKASLEMNFEKSIFTITSGKENQEIEFLVSEFDSNLVKSGGWVNFADERY
jgi:3-isopropylmalate/(R)-2-methylmalate dehydratase small subunit